jgi:hypothetical protein
VHDASPTFERVVRDRAARDLACADLVVHRRADGEASFEATGCGAVARYSCFEAPDGAGIYKVACRGGRRGADASAPATWGTR